MDDDTVKHYETKLRGCKTKEDLEKFTSEVVFFIQVYARARDAGYFKKADEVPKTKPAPKTETRSSADSTIKHFVAKIVEVGETRMINDGKISMKKGQKKLKNEKTTKENRIKNEQTILKTQAAIVIILILPMPILPPHLLLVVPVLAMWHHDWMNVEFKLSLKSVSEEKLNKKLGAEYTCANCGVVKDNYYPWEKEGKKYCSLDCQDSKDKKNTKSLGISSLKEFFNWMRKMGAVEVKFDLTTNQIIVKCNDGEKKLNLATSGLSLKLQEELKHAKEPITFSQVSKALDQKNKKNDNAAIFGAILLAGIILAVIIGVVVYNKKKRDY
ncbi:16107_t:CDS:2 [Entrophospora sp. SA101]|nr:16107_t:CDS:2 [Entrophospora sp. SA101]CAJ0824738.1 6768_t:CDS:2 [Entrophospora sp. SA101]CAJ0912876.1 11099_t:CDS:2 [Entrophospora sp. SA101]